MEEKSLGPRCCSLIIERHHHLMQGVGEIPISTTKREGHMETYNKQHNIPNIWVKKQFNSKGSLKNMFKWYEVGILGCGKSSAPWLDLSKYIEWPTNESDIVEELHNQLTLAGHRSGGGTCILPKELNGYHFLTHYQYFAEKYIPAEVREQLSTSQQLDAWVVANLGKPVWETALILKKQPDHSRYWTGKHAPGAEWQDPEIQQSYNHHKVEHGVTGRIGGPIPLTKSWINSLSIFKNIGRVLVYQNRIGHAVPTHRDFPINSYGHSAHFVNIQLSSTSRPAFVMDEVTKEKIYTNSKAYMFNESDVHGVDAEDVNNFTIRIDGTFQDWVCDELEFINGQVFSLDYANGYKFDSLRVIEPVDD